METLSINYAKKLLAIRCAEGLTQKEFAKITGISLSAVKIYESGHRPARSEIMEKVLQKKLFQKYTLWLLHDEIAPELGQCAANLTNKKPRRIKLSKKEKTTEKIEEKRLLLSDTQTIMSAISRMDEKEITILANVLSQRRSMFLLELLDPKNQALLSLSGLKKQAAYQLEDMDDEKVREILDEMDKANLESKTIEEINISHKKDRLIK